MNANPHALALLPIQITNEDGRVKTLAEIEGEVIAAVIIATGNKSEAAALLGISRATLWRKLAARNHHTNEGDDDEC